MTQLMKGIIFDFNGTLLWDSSLHEKAWNSMAEKYHGKSLNATEMEEQVHGRSNDNILRWLLGRELSPAELLLLANEKETMYRKLCHTLGDQFVLAPGAVDLLDSLTLRNIPRAIATSSSIDNVNFYIQRFDLYRWFDAQTLIYDDGCIQGKPAPDIYRKAMRALHLDDGDCMIVEDSLPGISSALAANAGAVYVIHESGNFEYTFKIGGITKTICNFSELSVDDFSR